MNISFVWDILCSNAKSDGMSGVMHLISYVLHSLSGKGNAKVDFCCHCGYSYCCCFSLDRSHFCLLLLNTQANVDPVSKIGGAVFSTKQPFCSLSSGVYFHAEKGGGKA